MGGSLPHPYRPVKARATWGAVPHVGAARPPLLTGSSGRPFTRPPTEEASAGPSRSRSRPPLLNRRRHARRVDVDPGPKPVREHASQFALGSTTSSRGVRVLRSANSTATASALVGPRSTGAIRAPIRASLARMHVPGSAVSVGPTGARWRRASPLSSPRA
jgi:hypothetical protein